MPENIKYFTKKSHAMRKLDSLTARFPAVAFALDKGFDGHCVAAHLTSDTIDQAGVLETAGVAVIKPSVLDDVNNELSSLTSQPPMASDMTEKEREAIAKADAKKIEADARAARQADIKRERAERKAKAEQSKEDVKVAKAEAKKKRANDAAQKKATTQAARAAKPKKAKAATRTRVKGETSAWKDSFAKAPAIIAAKIKEGKPPFKPKSKRDIVYKALLRGCTIEKVMELTGWNKATVSSSFFEIAHLMSCDLQRAGDKGNVKFSI